MRRLLVPLALFALAVSAAGCGGTPSTTEQKRVDFLNKYSELDDEQLAVLCPSLYPTDYLSTSDPDGPKKYHYTKNKTTFTPTAQQKADADAAGCTTQGTKPKD